MPRLVVYALHSRCHEELQTVRFGFVCSFPCTGMLEAISAAVQTRISTAFSDQEAIESFAARKGLAMPLKDMAALQLCRSVLFCKPLCQLPMILELLQGRIMTHANLFTRFPPYMKVCAQSVKPSPPLTTRKHRRRF